MIRYTCLLSHMQFDLDFENNFIYYLVLYPKMILTFNNHVKNFQSRQIVNFKFKKFIDKCVPSSLPLPNP